MMRSAARPLLALVCALTAAGGALAQTSPIADYGGLPSASASANRGATSDQSAGASAAGGGVANGISPAPIFSPVTIYSPPERSTPEDATIPVTKPGEQAGATSTPLYAKPGSTPGEFVLTARPPRPRSEFELQVEKVLGRPLARFGDSLVTAGARGFALGPNATVPPDYRLNPGDELLIDVTGSVEADLRLTIDAEGRIFIPRIGAINVAGVRYGDLADALARRFSQQYRRAQISVVIGHLHGIRVYVTGYAVNPGAYTVSSLSTLIDAVLAAGGPAAGGSFRSVELRRDGHMVTDLDLYDLLLRGDKSRDVVLQNEDVIYVEPTGAQVAITGAVNAEAIYEARRGETLGELIAEAGGPNSLADESRVVVSRLADLDAAGARQLTFAATRSWPAERADIVRVLSLGGIARPTERQAVLVTIDGEIDHPGRYFLPPGSTLGQLLARAGGLTPGAYVFGANLSRESVRAQQQISFDKAIDDLSLDAAAAPLSSLGTADRAASAQARLQASLAVIDRLKERKPDGRIVLNTPYGSSALPTDLPLETSDHLFVPPLPRTIGVFGAVYQPGSFLVGSGARIGDYLRLAGGPKKIADKSQIFVVRANGSVASAQQSHALAAGPALPGDVIFVPVRLTPTAFEKLRDIATVVYQLGVGAATLGILAAQF